MNMMKKGIVVTGAILAITLFGLESCEKSDDLNVKDIEGVYEGTFSVSSSLKVASLDGGEGDHGLADIKMMGDNQIEVHCFGEEIDTTFMLDYYEHNDSVMVCLTEGDFEHMYGHMLGEGHMGGMMSDISNSETQWMHHMNDEHEVDDEHFGGFDMQEMTFTYSFKMMDQASPYYLRFHGVKQ
jgi:hypothetical protein